MDEHVLWQQFSVTGRVEDYLRYRGVTLPINSAKREEEDYGGNKTASDDRRSDPAGLS